MTTVERNQHYLSSRRYPISIFILASVFVHGAGLLILLWLERSPSAIKPDTEPTPIEFVVVPPETATEEPPPDTERQAAKNSIARGKVKPDVPPATNKIGEESVKEPIVKQTPKPETPPKTPQPATPSQTQFSTPAAPSPAPPTKQNEPSNAATPPIVNQPSVTEDSLAAKTQPPEPNKPNPDIATNSLPAETSDPATEPATPPVSASSAPSNPETSSAASLLGGSYQRSLEDDAGDSFFNLQANASQEAQNFSGLDARQNLDMSSYFAEIRQRVKRNWNPAVATNERHTVLTFSIQKDGQITGLKIAQTSGSEVADRESLDAVRRSAPFAALPSSYPLNSLNIEFNFNIYIYR